MHYISQVLTVYFLFPAKICSVRCLSLILCNYYFSLQIPTRPLFSACIITPVKFFDTFHLLMSSSFNSYLRVRVTY